MRDSTRELADRFQFLSLMKLILDLLHLCDVAGSRDDECVALLPLWNKKELEAEAQRCLDMGIKGFVLPDMPETLGVPSFDDPSVGFRIADVPEPSGVVMVLLAVPLLLRRRAA